MRRTPFLAAVGITSDRLKNMNRNGHAPLIMNEEEGADGWSEYSTGDVIKTALAIAMNGEGLDKGTAAAMASRGFPLVKNWWTAAGDTKMPAIYFGAALASWSAGTGEATSWFPIAGPLSHIGENKIGHRTLYRLGDVEGQVSKLLLVNVSRLRRDVEQRAHSAGITLDFADLAAI